MKNTTTYGLIYIDKNGEEQVCGMNFPNDPQNELQYKKLLQKALLLKIKHAAKKVNMYEYPLPFSNNYGQRKKALFKNDAEFQLLVDEYLKTVNYFTNKRNDITFLCKETALSKEFTFINEGRYQEDDFLDIYCSKVANFATFAILDTNLKFESSKKYTALDIRNLEPNLVSKTITGEILTSVISRTSKLNTNDLSKEKKITFEQLDLF